MLQVRKVDCFLRREADAASSCEGIPGAPLHVVEVLGSARLARILMRTGRLQCKAFKDRQVAAACLRHSTSARK